MREYIFRGETRRFGEKVNMAGEKLPAIWVYGGVLQGSGDFSIIYGSTSPDGKFESKYPVYTDTVGMFTGREAYKGDNKVKLFEGDRCILTLFDYNGLDTQYECAVEWCGGCFAFVNEEKGIFVPLCNVEDTDSDVEVVGTIYDKEGK